MGKLTGKSLEQFVTTEQTNVNAIAENLIYKKSITMRSGDPGVGKSIVSANIIRDLSVGQSVFNFFHVSKPAFCYYIPFERGAYEIAQRFQGLRTVREPNWDNIVINPDFVGYDVYDLKQAKYIQDTVIADLEPIASTGIEIVVFFDPIISMVSGEIKEEKYAKAITRCANIIQSRIGCAIELNNHTVKNQEGRPDPFYGSQAFKAFCTSGVHLSRAKAGGLTMTSTKSSHGNVVEKIHLNYDRFTYSLFANINDSGLRTYDRVKMAVKDLRKSGIEVFTFHHLYDHALCQGVGESSIKEVILNDEPFKSGIAKKTGVGKPTELNFSSKWID